jgi:hypothetical protein
VGVVFPAKGYLAVFQGNEAMVKERIREITRRAKSVSMETTMAQLVPYMRSSQPIATAGAAEDQRRGPREMLDSR